MMPVVAAAVLTGAVYGSMKGFRDLADLLNDSFDPD